MMKNKNTLRGAMATYGITVAHLADVVGVSTLTLSKKLNGRVAFTLPEALMVVAYLNSQGEAHTVESLFDVPGKQGQEEV